MRCWRLPAWVLLRVLVGIVEGAASVPFATVSLGPPFDVLAGAIAIVGLLAVTWWRRRPQAIRLPGRDRSPTPSDRAPAATPLRVDGDHVLARIGIVALIVAATVTGGIIAARPPGIPRVSVLDVGQGDAILVEGSHGGRLLIDGGPDPDRLLVELDRRIPPWDRRVDAVILSHPHEDHVAGLAMLLARYRVGRVFEPGMRGPGPGYAAWLRALAGQGAPVRHGLAAGDQLRVDEIRLRVLWPIAGQVPVDPPDGGTGINNVSVVLLGEVAGRRFLLMGDVEEGIDPTLLAAGLPTVDFLKIAHHGSRTATTQPFVDAVRPKVAVASAGADNPYGHPARATLDRLAAAGARVDAHRSGRDGRRDLRAGRDERPGRWRPDGSPGGVRASRVHPGRIRPSGAGLLAGPPRGVSLCHPGDRAGARTRRPGASRGQAIHDRPRTTCLDRRRSDRPSRPGRTRRVPSTR